MDKSRSNNDSKEIGADFAERDNGGDTSSFGTDSGSDIANISADILNSSFLNCTNDLELCFIFICTDVHGLSGEYDDEEDEDLSDRKKAKKA